MVLLLAISCIWRIFCLGTLAYAKKRNTDISPKARLTAFVLCLLTGFLLRCYFAAGDIWHSDVVVYEEWARRVRETGYKNFYTSGYYWEYPPGFIYLMSIAGYAEKIFGFSERVFVFIIKLFPVLADLGLGVLIYIIAKNKSRILAVTLSACFLLCPAFINESRIWGQSDSLIAFLVALSVYLLVEDKITLARISFALGLLIKPQALLFGPVLLLAMLEKRDFKKTIWAIVSGLGTVWLLALPFSQGLSPLWLLDLFWSTMHSFNYISLADNIYSLLHINALIDTNPFVEMVNPRMIIFLLCVGAYGYIKQEGKCKNYSYACMVMACIFAFCTMMHERYLLPAVFFAVAAYIYSGAKGYFLLFLALGTQTFLNPGKNMIDLGYFDLSIPPFTDTLLGLGACICAIWSLGLFLRDSIKGERPFPLPQKLFWPAMTCIVTVCRALISFRGLGRGNAPATFWQSGDAGESLILDFGEEKNVKAVYSYSLPGDANYPRRGGENKTNCDFTYLRGDGDSAWTPVGDTLHKYLFTWKKDDTDFTTRYVKVSRNSPERVLGEIVFVDDEGRIISVTPGSPQYRLSSYIPYNALDESETAPIYFSGYYRSAYFDEIYFARTAYEYLNNYPVYENTHPPLGKILIALGIAIFGVNPFGWRFMGALVGVLLIPLIYLVGKKLFHSRRRGFFCALLLSLDFMRYAQSRIATVDIFTVFFLLLSFLFMARYAEIPLDKKPGRQRLCLCGSGLFLGCAIAVKWNGAFASVRLAVFFFFVLWDKYRRFAGAEGKKKDGAKKCLFTCLSCVILFVLVPRLVYFVSFKPLLENIPPAERPRQFLNMQINMFNYHHNLQAEHSFASRWYTWPVCAKPIWLSIERMGEKASSISSYPNPVIAFFILARIPFAGIMGTKKEDRGALAPFFGYIFCLLPWIFISRLTFIYHYFPSLIFGILARGFMLDKMCKGRQGKARVAVFLSLSAVMFLVFFPSFSGLPVSKGWLRALELGRNWHFV